MSTLYIISLFWILHAGSDVVGLILNWLSILGRLFWVYYTGLSLVGQSWSFILSMTPHMCWAVWVMHAKPSFHAGLPTILMFGRKTIYTRSSMLGYVSLPNLGLPYWPIQLYWAVRDRLIMLGPPCWVVYAGWSTQDSHVLCWNWTKL